jgi:tRNA pseudouridine38-40 synthase
MAAEGNLQRCKVTVSYDGTDFQGWQIQPNARTVQAELESAFAVLEPERNPRITGSGRTDAGVHARAQVFHVDVTRPFEPDKWRDALNGLIPEDIRILSVENTTGDFHARFSATGKQYRYFIHLGSGCPPYQRHIRHSVRRLPKVALMKAAAQELVGEHDFRSFSAIRVDADENTVRTVRTLDILEHEGELEIVVEAGGFLYKMVRQLVGAMLRVGQGELSISELRDLLERPRVSHDAPSAPAKGLFLWEVFYDRTTDNTDDH